MARGRGRRRDGLANVATRSTRSQSHRPPHPADGVPSIYQDMLAEVAGADPDIQDHGRPLKRRKITSDVETSSSSHDKGRAARPNTMGALADQVDGEPSESDDSDYGFEDVDLEQAPDGSGSEHDGLGDISVTVDPIVTPTKRVHGKRNTHTAAEKSFRLLVHKAHILCLLGHCLYINKWCNSEAVQQILHPLLSQKTLSYLATRAGDSQFQRNRSFIDGLHQASEMFRAHFKLTASGMRKARWPIDDDVDVHTDTDAIDRAEFVAAAREMEGSQDTANQLFCALLRSAGVAARLVCSLQPLPFVRSSTRNPTPQKAMKTIIAIASPPVSSKGEERTYDRAVQDSATIGNVSSVKRRIGQPTFPPEPHVSPARKRKRHVQKLSYPIFWVEAFNTAHQKWIPVDPMVTQSINKATKLEPPLSYEHNHLSYVVAFEDSGAARDVTRRYAKTYNAKTRRHRVESSDGGTQWLRKAMRALRRPYSLDRDQVEDAELAQKEAREGLPLNVLDFKDHPFYALERHLKRHEVLHPRREVGKVNAGTAAKPRMEPVYRREDVIVCRSADKWYRLGRVVKEGEQPLKHILTRHRRGRSDLQSGDDEEADTSTALYGPQQTDLYVPQPVVKGIVPRNAYGNLDIYVPSMIPAGGTHVRNQLAQRAAKLLRVSYSDAVTGFQFKGRHGTPVVEGVIVPSECADAVWAVIEGFYDDQEENASMARSAVALRLWKRFLIGLRIAERVRSHTADDGDIQEALDAAEDEQEITHESGGFFPGEGDAEVPMPTAGQFSLDELGTAAQALKRSRRRKFDDSTDDGSELSRDSMQVSRSRGQGWETTSVDSDGNRTEETTDYYGEAGGFLDYDRETQHNSDTDVNNDGTLELSEVGGGFLTGESNGIRPEEGRSNTPPEPDDSGGGFVLEDNDAEGEEDPTLPLHLEESNIAVVANRAVSAQPTGNTGGEMDISNDLDQTLQGGPSLPVSREESAVPEGGMHVQKHTVDIADDDVREAENGTANALPLSPDIVRDQQRTPLEESAATDGEQNDRGSDIGSMLSHDPEDEDAEPDWL